MDREALSTGPPTDRDHKTGRAGSSEPALPAGRGSGGRGDRQGQPWAGPSPGSRGRVGALWPPPRVRAVLLSPTTHWSAEVLLAGAAQLSGLKGRAAFFSPGCLGLRPTWV